ncbi:polysaccharide lyase family 8 super-sandwich domain-containing protein, partial [Clostridium perfringens]
NITNDPKPNSDSQDIMSANWAYISGNVSGADVGYYFPNKTNLKVRNVENTGTWQAIGSSGPVDSNDQPLNITNNYLEMWFDHGVNPTDASYEYVMLPNQTKQQVEEYAKNPSITVLSNTSSVQAVKENKLN